MMNIWQIEQEIHKEILQYLQEKGNIDIDEKEVRRLGFRFLEKKKILLPTEKINKLIENITFSIIGYGPLEELLRTDSISEIMVNGPKKIWIEKNGKIELTGYEFRDSEQLLNIISRIVGKIGRRIDESNPMVDARLEDGSRVNAIIPPLSLIGPVLTIRKFPKKSFTLNDLIEKNSVNQEIADFLRLCILNKKNIIISGGTGSGKTSTLNALASLIPKSERIITIEDSAEIRIDHPHLISLESRIANLEGKGEIPIRTLVKNALRMRPDRIVVGEIRSGEAIDMLQAMNTGHEGSLTTVHANSPLESLYRIETMVLMGNIDIPLSAIRPQIVQGIDIILQQARLSNGKRKIINVSEIKQNEGFKEYEIKDIFYYDSAKDQYIASGHMPAWIKKT